MLKYNKTYPYLLSFLHPSVQAYYIIHKHHIAERRKHKFSDNLFRLLSGFAVAKYN